jgi:putative membrane-bound dehydrogenase-like protein
MPIARPMRIPLALWFWLGAALPAPAALPKAPPEFEVRLVATVPAVEFPCQLATAPDGSLFVAEDPMDQVGPYEADLGRILLFRDGREPVVFADGFRAIFGMAWRDGALYVMNMPRLTILRDLDGDGKADERTELFKDLGPGPIKDSLNDHIVSGLQFGMDGWLYISVGDKGIPLAHGPDGRTVTLQGGGIVRCRPDGTQLEIFSSGTRNHLEPNLDDRDHLFTYDNTDDGNGWWTRVTHHIDGGYYGYPYDYHNRPDRMLPRMAEYGGGSPCGGVVYKEDAWPEKYRGRALWAEWGKREVPAFQFQPKGATFEVADVIRLLEPVEGLDFRPIDLALSYDGRTLYVADWCTGGWGQKEKVGRVYALTYKGKIKTRPRGRDSDPIEAQIRQLDHPSFNERMRAQAALIKNGLAALGPLTTALANPKTDPVARRHLIWALDGIAGGTPEATSPLIELLKSPVADLRAQAARALGQRAVVKAVGPLTALLKDREPSVRLQAIIALGRIGDAHAAPALLPSLADEDIFISFSARQALRRIGDWKAVASGLKARDAKVRAGVLRTMEQVYEIAAAKALAQYATEARNPADERAQALVYLAQGHRKTRPWDGKWWGTIPAQGPPPEKVVDWEGTPLALKTIRDSLSDRQAPVRVAAVEAVAVVRDRSMLTLLHKRFTVERDPAVKSKIARTFGAMDDKSALPLLTAALRDAKAPEPVRDAALSSIETIGTDAAARALTELLARPDLTPERQPRVIAALGQFQAKVAVPIIAKKLSSPSAAVRAAAATALGQIGVAKGVLPKLRPLVDDRDSTVRKAALGALGALKDRESIPTLLRAAEAEDTRFEATLALAAMPELKALQVYLRGLADKSPELRKAAADALAALRDQAAPVLDQLAARRELAPSLVPELQKVFSGLQPIMQWRLLGPFPIDKPPAFAPDRPLDVNAAVTGPNGTPLTWKLAQASSDKGEINLGRIFSDHSNQVAFGYAEIQSPEDRQAEMAIGSDDTLTVWLNGTQVFDFQGDRGFEPEKDHFQVTLVKGINHILIRCGNHGDGWQFSVAVAAPASYAFLKLAPSGGGFDPDAYRAFALKTTGNPEHGRVLFHDPKGLGCIKCHNVGGEGGMIGPELSSVGAKYPRDELITAVLAPSAKISQGYEPVTIATTDGRVLSGVVKSDTPQALEIADAEAKLIKVPKTEIEERRPSAVSIMPIGLAEGLTRQDFADLIAYLESLKQVAPAANQKASGGR